MGIGAWAAGPAWQAACDCRPGGRAGMSAATRIVSCDVTAARAPLLQCKDFVHSELLRIASQCAPPEVKRFQILGVSRLCPRPCTF